MPIPLTLETFTGFLRELDEEELVEFVADLWAATGWETRVDGCEVIATRAGRTSNEQRYRVEADDRGAIARTLRDDEISTAGDADGVIVGYRSRSRENADRNVIDAADLYDRLLFALDRRTCRELCERHFGRTVDPAPAQTPSITGIPLRIRARQALVDPSDRTFLLVGVAFLLVLFGVANVAGIPGNTGADRAPIGFGELDDDPTPVGGIVPLETGVGTSTGTRTPQSTSRSVLVPLEWANPDHVGALPTCNRTSREVVEVFVAAARFESANRTDRFRTMALFTDSHPFGNPEQIERLVEQTRSGPLSVLFTFDAAFLGEEWYVEDPDPSVRRAEGATKVQEVVLQEGSTSHGFQFFLTERHRRHEVCWQIQAIRPKSTPVSTDRVRISTAPPPQTETRATNATPPTPTAAVSTTN